DVAGADDGHLGLRHEASFVDFVDFVGCGVGAVAESALVVVLAAKVTPTVPSDEISALTVVPGVTECMGPRAPERTTWPARNGSPTAWAVRASQRSARSGSPRHAAPFPSETSSSSAVIRIVTATGSNSSSGTGWSPSTKSALEPL